jgi:hypothetical protein
MRTLLLAAIVAGTCMVANAASTKIISITERDGAAYVSAADLESSAAIAVKNLPGTDAVVACSADRCAKVRRVVREGEVTWVNVAELAKALGFEARFSNDRRQVQFKSETKSTPADGSVTRVGDLAPNFRLPRLDGSPVSLADFRGKRVLIQSWGSW